MYAKFQLAGATQLRALKYRNGAGRITAWIDSAAPRSTQHDRAWIPPGRSPLDSALLWQTRQSLDRLSGSWEPWLLLHLQLVYLARHVSAGKRASPALICMIQYFACVFHLARPLTSPRLLLWKSLVYGLLQCGERLVYGHDCSVVRPAPVVVTVCAARNAAQTVPVGVLTVGII